MEPLDQGISDNDLRQKWFKPQQNFQIGDLVLVNDKNIPRGLWPIGMVTKVFPGPDGKIRTVELRTKDSVYIRPIVKVALLEETNYD